MVRKKAKMKARNIMMCCVMPIWASSAIASQASDAAFVQFKAAGADNFSAEHGKLNWSKETIGQDGDKRSCTTCHGPDPTKPGQHATTKKIIDPMAIRANAARFTDLKKMDKWFKRNCEWTWGRECTAQEKGDILTFLLSVN
jgi:hypothetical protein